MPIVSTGVGANSYQSRISGGGSWNVKPKGYADTLADLQKQQNTKTKAQETEIRGLLDQIIGMYQPGGSFGQGTEAMLAREKQKAVASGTQSLVSSGLSNTTSAAGLGTQFEEAVGAPTRAKLEDLRYAQLSQALGNKANFIENIQQTPIDYATLAQLIQTGAMSGNAAMGMYK